MTRRTRSATTFSKAGGDSQKRAYTPEIKKTDAPNKVAGVNDAHVIDVWAWRYGKDREWKSVRECKMKIANYYIRIFKGEKLLQEVPFGDVKCVFNYITSARLIIGVHKGHAMFLSLDKKDHSRFQELMTMYGLNSKPVSYGEFFRQQKSLIFPALPVVEGVSQGSSAAGSGSGTPTQSAEEPETEQTLLRQLQQQLEDLKTKNVSLNYEMSRLNETRPRLLHHPHIATTAPCTPQAYTTLADPLTVPYPLQQYRYNPKLGGPMGPFPYQCLPQSFAN
eukprot:TRINITY_DN700_c2_g1_i2.p1 TRINITY_DN700_c2_g1~~TRINITY_DN700_c2_g1_i2.p1  ORF type:complete len:301 (+),score=60.06 TRINITY_DN700_c2_g1_i2:70-903(+)